MISIIIPTYNRCQLLRRAIESVRRQTIQEEREIIVVDDASTDETRQYVEGLKDEVIYIRNPENKGACYSRNEGFKAAQGECVAFLDSDNYWDEGFLENRREYINAGCDLAVGRILVLEESEGQEKRTVVPEEPLEVLQDTDRFMRTMLIHNVIDTNSALMKREAVQKIGGFDPEQKRFQDWEFFLHLLTVPDLRYIFLDNALVNNQRGEDSISYRQELIWPSTMRIFRKYIGLYEQYNFVEEKIFHMLLDPAVDLDAQARWEDLRPIAEQRVDMEELFCRCFRMYEKERQERERAENLNGLYRCEDEKKENRIRELETALDQKKWGRIGSEIIKAIRMRKS
jgi:glycosyltransferase involved in cell wall biosynthesis